MSEQAVDRVALSQIGEFELRSARLQWAARLTLVTIYVLIGLGAVVFLYARQITSGDIAGPSLDDKLKATTSDLQNTEARLRDTSQTINSVIAEYKSAVEEFITANQPAKPDTISQWQYALSYGGITVPTPAEVADDIVKVAGRAKAESHDSFRINITLNGERAIFLTQGQTQAFADKLRAATFPTKIPLMATEEQRLTDRYNFLSNVLLGLKNERVRQAVEGNRPDSDTLDNPSWVRLIQTNVTRFGTLLMVTFMVSILVPLYRYNVRLSAYYLARADALKLMQTQLGSLGFAELAAVLTPQMDFGKSPQTPIEQIIELVRIAARSEHK